jgi:hypothetical protein
MRRRNPGDEGQRERQADDQEPPSGQGQE